MKIKQTLKFLLLSAALLLALQAAHARPLDHSAVKAWRNLQNKMASLSVSSAPEDLLAAEANVIDYQSAVAQTTGTGWNDHVSDIGLAAEEDLLNTDTSNPSSLIQTSIDFNSFGAALLEARVGSANTGSNPDIENCYKKIAPLFGDVSSDLVAWQEDLLNQAPVDQTKAAKNEYDRACKKLHHVVSKENKLSLQDAVNAAALTPDEQQLWNQFQSRFATESKAVCSSYRINPTFANFPGVEEDLQNLDPRNPAAVLEVELYKNEAVHANISTFKLLQQGCLYEFLNVLLTKRNDPDTSLNSFHQLQGKLNQFLNNLEVSNSIALLQAQVDMLAYEKEVTVLSTAPAAK